MERWYISRRPFVVPPITTAATTSPLQRVFTGYGRGLTAFYTSLLVRHPLAIGHLAGLSGRAMYDLFSSDGKRLRKVESTFPRELIRANLRGMLEGPLMYPAALGARARQLRTGATP